MTKVPLKKIQDFDGNFYELVVATIMRTEQIIDNISLAEHAIFDDKILGQAFNDVLTGKFRYSIEGR
ncbi:DNA-directed RNA polymerase subunit omega [Borreliella burgdorferi]|uniref:DNA-directed RNA polymerase, omega subunit n=3 Tax=Borreliella burgdorferi TaxID=139 RepID=O51760_BORBU|nr:DNA-directed RNA polymerase subunit omega [Borreliella burgdorferi]AGS66816.1 DNA-directed RNA polymerase subunit omega [Borreliella burgdorferi CA382]EOA79914.1 DNA-directed RNA polymerase, omega subunit [Borreliella burgdorferi CA8]AAC67174.1 DNA-directed RNA polymerase, omega subunit [Borreliella burgdorferi B31]ACK74486.1 DNA-directed RNA polymerase, omega subunit [Borreliella burgdorferi ZS7]ADQ29166.1 DNA-directed RNA polymerase, omega subunit [Borreliella burgdorferi N40]